MEVKKLTVKHISDINKKPRKQRAPRVSYAKKQSKTMNRKAGTPKSQKKTHSSSMVVGIERSAKKLKAALKDAPPEKAFWFNNGPIVKNLKEFRDALRSITDEQFDHHTQGKRSDFVAWVEEVLEDIECAQKLKNVPTREHAAAVVDRHIG